MVTRAGRDYPTEPKEKTNEQRRKTSCRFSSSVSTWYGYVRASMTLGLQLLILSEGSLGFELALHFHDSTSHHAEPFGQTKPFPRTPRIWKSFCKQRVLMIHIHRCNLFWCRSDISAYMYCPYSLSLFFFLYKKIKLSSSTIPKFKILFLKKYYIFTTNLWLWRRGEGFHFGLAPLAFPAVFPNILYFF